MAKSKEIKTSKIEAVIYNKALRSKIVSTNQFLVGPGKTVGLQFDSKKEGAFTTLVGKKKDKLFVVIGGKMVQQIAKAPDSFMDKKSFLPYYDPIVKAFYGLDYHEMGHVLYTDMYDTSIAEYPEEKYRGFFHTLFNIIEDQVIEVAMCNRFTIDEALSYATNPRIYFDFMIERIFRPQCDEYKDDGTQTGFVNYLLLSLRCGKSAIKNKCAIFEKYRADLVPLVKDVLFERNATERIHKTIVLGEWIVKNITEFSWEMPEPPIKEWPPLPPDGPEGPGGGPTVPVPVDTPEPPKGTEPKDPFEPHEKAKEKPGESEVEGGTPPEEVIDDISDDIDDVFNDVIHDGDDHEWVIAKDEYEIINENIIDKINEKINEFAEPINEVSSFLTLFKGRKKPRMETGHTRGRLNIYRAMQDEAKEGCDIKLFSQKVTRGKTKDLAVSLLCDNSGSMSGTKSELASNAALVLAQACDWSKIPFECNAFTKTEDSFRGTCITIREKSFDDDFEKAKPYFAINDSHLIRALESHRYIPTFYGNSEEVNLYYIGKEFSRVNHKTKLLFVFCDGATTGSVSDLKKIVRQIEEEDRIIVIGIGICCPAVASIYPHHKIFHSTSEMEQGLAQYLIDTLSEYAV